MPVFNNMLAGASGGAGGGYEIERSIRFNSGDSAFLNRTPSSAGNRKTWTWSGWVKRSSLGARNTLFDATVGWTGSGDNTYGLLNFEPGDKLGFGFASGGAYTTAVFRDTSAWYHVVAAMDTTQASAADRLKLYVNGVQHTHSGYTLAQNYNYAINTATEHAIGVTKRSNSDRFNGYLADVHFIDGQALAPTDFGAPDDNGVWQPIKYAGTYGTNGFHLDFKDNSSNAALGTDTSGVSPANTWTVNNFTAIGSDYSGTATGYITSPLNALNGDLSNGASAFPAGNSGDYVFNNPITITGTLKVYTVNGSGTGHSGGSAVSVKVDGTWTVVNSSPNSYSSNLNTLGSSFQGFRIYTAASSGSPGLMGIEANGALLVHAPANTDSLRDSPSQIADQTDTGAGGEVVGNYCTLNPLKKGDTYLTLSNGNLDGAQTSGSPRSVLGTIGMSSGKYYWEWTWHVGSFALVGIGTDSLDLNANAAQAYGWCYQSDGRKRHNNASTNYNSTAYAAGSVIGIAFNADNGELSFYKDGVSQGVAFTVATGTTYFPAMGTDGMDSWSINFGQRPFVYTNAGTNRPSADFKCLNTANLDPPTIADGSKYFEAKKYDGNGGTQTISNLEFSPDFTWLKKRSGTADHYLYDQVRGATYRLYSNVGLAESTSSTGLTAFTSDGFSLGNANDVNQSSNTYISWNWDAGTSTVTNNDGTIASSIRASAASGFSIVTWTGNGQNNASVGHGLNAPPSIVIIKNRSSVTSFHTYVKALDSTGQYQLYLDGTAASTNFGSPFFNTDSTKINLVSGSSAGINASGNFVAWCFAPVAGYSAMGSYTGTGTSGIFVHTGMSPSWVLIKDTTNSGTNWLIFDSERDPHNLASTFLRANSSGNEIDNQHANGSIDFLSNGFTVRASGTSNANTTINVPNSTVVWMAFAKHPFKTARAR